VVILVAIDEGTMTEIELQDDVGPAALTVNGLRLLEWVSRGSRPSPVLDLLGIAPAEDADDPGLFDGAQALVACGQAYVDGDGLALAPSAASLAAVMQTLRSSILIAGLRGEALSAARLLDGEGFRLLVSGEAPALLRVGLIDSEVALSEVINAVVSDLIADDAEAIVINSELADVVGLMIDRTDTGSITWVVEPDGERSSVGDWGSESATAALTLLVQSGEQHA
jgi:hypothetical protein